MTRSSRRAPLSPSGRPARTSPSPASTPGPNGARVTGEMHPPLKDDEGRLNASFVEWLMGLSTDNAANLSRCARIRLASNAVVGLQARLMLQRGLTAINDTKGNPR